MSRPRALLVEDDPDLREMLTWALMDAFEVDTVTTGEEAVDRLTQSAYDLVVADIRLPGIDGLEVLEAARRRRLAVTGYSSEADLARAEAMGIEVLKKPFGIEEINDTIARLMGDGRSSA
ncbi:MAG: response regulator [Candidatus Eremiobacterota bacterium]